MGGYSSWSAAENAAYAEKTGTANIGAGVGWKTTALSKGLTPTTESTEVAAALNRLPEYSAKMAQIQPTPFKSQSLEQQREQSAGSAKLAAIGKSATINVEKQASSLPPTSAGTYQPYYQGFVFGNENAPYKSEGTYHTVGDVEITMPETKASKSVTHKGTLYKSDLGAWEVVDAKHQLVMSGSAAAPIPSFIDLVPKSTGTVAKVAASEVEAAAAKTEGVDYSIDTYKSVSPKGSEISSGLYSTAPSPAAAAQQQTTKPSTGSTTLDVLSGNLWGATSALLSGANTKTGIVKKIGEYDVYADNTVKNRVTGETISLGSFGAKRKRSSTGIKKPVKKQTKPSTGFMGTYQDLNKQVSKKSKIKKTAPATSTVYHSIWSTLSSGKPKKPMAATTKRYVKPNVKKTVKKQESQYSSAWSDVLFDRPKKTTKKHK